MKQLEFIFEERGHETFVEGMTPEEKAFFLAGVPPPRDVPRKPVTSANPKQAYGDLKAAVHTVPPALILGAAKGNKEGADKYGAFNWRNTKVQSMTYAGAIMRHLLAYIDGEDVDPESKTGKLHLEGIAASVGILLDAHYGGFMIDNRPPKGPAPKMVLTPKEG